MNELEKAIELLESNGYRVTPLSRPVVTPKNLPSQMQMQDLIEKLPGRPGAIVLKDSGISIPKANAACQTYFGMSFAECRQASYSLEIERKKKRSWGNHKPDTFIGKRIDQDEASNGYIKEMA